jgi:hypothetical protein
VIPTLPPRSSSPPAHATASAIACWSSGSPAASGGTTPSPLNTVPSQTFPVSATSAIEMASAVPLSSRSRMRRAALAAARPSGVAPSMADSGSTSLPGMSCPRSRSRTPHQRSASRISGARTRPSRSRSRSSSVRPSSSSPFVGQLSATHSFWSRCSSSRRSRPDMSATWSRPPKRWNTQRWRDGVATSGRGRSWACSEGSDSARRGCAMGPPRPGNLSPCRRPSHDSGRRTRDPTLFPSPGRTPARRAPARDRARASRPSHRTRRHHATASSRRSWPKLDDRIARCRAGRALARHRGSLRHA